MGEAKDGATDRSVAGPHRRLRRRGDGATRRAGAAQDAPALHLHRDRFDEGGSDPEARRGDTVHHRGRDHERRAPPGPGRGSTRARRVHALGQGQPLRAHVGARAEPDDADRDAGPKLLKAGAGAVVSMATIGALRLASAMVRPNVVDLLDAMLREPGATRVEEVTVGRAAAGQTLGTMKLQERTGVIVFALREAATQRHVFNPPPDRVLETGDVLMGCAAPEQVAALQRIVTEG